jgi:hypothetical protein
MWTEFLNWFGALPPASAGFLGTLTGSGLGLIALLIGALFNAWLNRKRDDRLRKHERRAVAAALRAELSRQSRTLLDNAKRLEELKGDTFLVPDIAQSIRVLSNVIDKLGFLDERTIEAVIDAHVVIEQYCGKLVLDGGEELYNSSGTRRSVLMRANMASMVRGANLGVDDVIQKAIKRLSGYLG